MRVIYPNHWTTTVDEGKGRLNSSRDRNKGKHRRVKVEKFCVTTAGASTSLTSRINGMTTHTNEKYYFSSLASNININI